MNRINIIYIPLLFFFFCSYGCDTKSQKKEQHSVANIHARDTLFLYKVDSHFLKYMPDTTLQFSSPAAKTKYSLDLGHRFYKYKDSLRNHVSNFDRNRTAVSIARAERMFEDYMMLLSYKFAKKDKSLIVNLAFYSSYITLVPLDSMISLFYTFSKAQQNTQAGQEILKSFQRLKFDSNKGKNLTDFPPIVLVDSNMEGHKQVKSDLLKKKYNIITFGASWCAACRVGERLLASVISQVDTTNISITSLSLDRSFLKWKKSVQEDELPWANWILENEFKNAWAEELKIESIPINLLVDEHGKIMMENADLRVILAEIPNVIVSKKYTD